MLKKIKINKVVLQNRIFVGPMCQYSADGGKPSKWHYEHSKVQLMSRFLNLSIVATSILIIGIGIFLIRVI